MWDGYASLAGQEIVNSARAAVYAGNAGLTMQCDPCDSTAAALQEDPYWDVRTDPAPWYDANQPQSAGFYGIFGIGVVGFNSNPISREPAVLVGDGSSLGTLRRTGREIVYTVALLAAGECELSYGLEYLAAVLNGSECGTNLCSGDELCVFSCCPGEGPDTGVGDLGDAEIRHLYDVGLLEGPTVNETRIMPGGILWAEVTFTLVAGKPWIYRDPLPTLSDWVPLADGDLVNNYDPDQIYQQCLTPRPCIQDPLCPQPELPPRPPAPVSPCYPQGLANFRRTRISVSPLVQHQWLETTPVLEVQTGGGEMRRLIVRFWANPQGNECTDFNDPCNACTDISIAYLPSGSTLTVDGRVQRSIVECPQEPIGTATATPTVYGPRGASFSWPVFGCPTGMCIEVWSRADATADDAMARVLLVPRSDVG